MNVMFWVILLIFLVLCWFLFAFVFKPVGKFFYRIWEDAIDILLNGNEKEEK